MLKSRPMAGFQEGEGEEMLSLLPNLNETIWAIDERSLSGPSAKEN